MACRRPCVCNVSRSLGIAKEKWGSLKKRNGALANFDGLPRSDAYTQLAYDNVQGLRFADPGMTNATRALTMRTPGRTVWDGGSVNSDAVLLLDDVPALEASTPAALDEFQLNLDDLSLDTDWDLLSPFKTAASTRSRSPDLAVVANDPAFRSDLRQLPEVSELSAEQHADSAFADWPVAGAKDELILDDAFTDAFAREPLKRSQATELNDLQHLASNRQNLVKLNKALAYIEQGNLASACDILNEVIIEGDDEQKLEARALLARIA